MRTPYIPEHTGARMSRRPTRMTYAGPDGRTQELSLAQATALAAIRDWDKPGEPVSRFDLSLHTGVVRAMADNDLAKVEWLEHGDVNREGAWHIHGLTAFGSEILGRWIDKNGEPQ